MNVRAKEILEEVKALPTSERATFLKLFYERQITSEKLVEEPKEAEWPDFAGRMKTIFGERTIPGDPQKFWDEERGQDL